MKFGDDLFWSAIALHEPMDGAARQTVRDWLCSYRDSNFEEAVDWLLTSDLGLVGSGQHLNGCQAIKMAIDELRADVKAEAFSGWGAAPGWSEVVQALADRVAKPARQPS
jgi:hypothetical protein